jgi:hypothetical protein
MALMQRLNWNMSEYAQRYEDGIDKKILVERLPEFLVYLWKRLNQNYQQITYLSLNTVLNRRKHTNFSISFPKLNFVSY